MKALWVRWHRDPPHDHILTLKQPSGDAESQTYQIGELTQHLDTINNQSSAIVNNGLRSLMTDAASFITFAGHGGFSGAVRICGHYTSVFKCYRTDPSLQVVSYICRTGKAMLT